MRLSTVQTRADNQDFLQLPVRLYSHDPNWIQPLNKDVLGVFDPNINKEFRTGEAERWLLRDEKNQVIGRIAAFFSRKSADKDNAQPTGGVGFFECIDSQEAANMLFDVAKEWLISKGMEAMDGPINFGQRDQWWGLLVKGFTEPNYCCNYHLPYYKALFENYGFQEYFQQYTYFLGLKDNLKPSVREKSAKLMAQPGYTFRCIKKSELKKCAEDFRYIYNKAWVKHKGVGEITSQQAMAIMNKIKPILDPELIWFGYHNDEPIAFFIMLPEVNQIFKHMKGEFGLLQKIKFLWHKWRGTCTKIFGVVFGVIPEFQGRGVESAIVMSFAPIALSPDFRYKSLELNWIGDFNPKMLRVCDDIGGELFKTHITYRYLFDREKPYTRMPIIK
ncbi:MAG: hypothetical protein EAZ57_11200 [Cytophagales bacterium]|nr:MAG: hypothetical protein EAZ67_11860 [Cytophagales bacterium]TAF59451.1 MAG: hypothetical protein EAZ57_11200 [Cytophagales bacterium]